MKTYTVTLRHKEKISDDLYLLKFDSAGSGFEFAPGQYAHFTIDNPKFNDEKGNTRPLSIANAPNDDCEIVILIRAGESAFARNLILLEHGSTIKVSEAKGDAVLPEDVNMPVIFIAGGTGITPVRSLMESDLSKGNKRRVHLFYATRSLDQAAFKDDLAAWQKLNSKINVTYVTDEDDRSIMLNKEFFDRHIDNHGEYFYYVFGPPSMVISMRELLQGIGVDEERIVCEKFS